MICEEKVAKESTILSQDVRTVPLEILRAAYGYRCFSLEVGMPLLDFISLLILEGICLYCTYITYILYLIFVSSGREGMMTREQNTIELNVSVPRERCCQQGCLAMKTMLLPHCSEWDGVFIY